MNAKLTFQICLCCLLIFALGIWVGRMSKPGKEGAQAHPDLENSLDPSHPEFTKREIKIATRRSFKRYQDELQLSPEQIEELRPAFEKVGRRMIALPKRSKARLAVLEDFHDEIRPSLQPEQIETLDEILEGARSMLDRN